MRSSKPDLRPSPAVIYEAIEAFDGSVAKAAEYLGVDATTVRRWRKRPEYRAFLADLHSVARDRVCAQAAKDIRDALEAARKCLASPDPHARLQASRLLLDVHERLYGANEAAGAAEDQGSSETADGLKSKVLGALARVRGAKKD